MEPARDIQPGGTRATGTGARRWARTPEILLVEDEAPLRESVAEALEQEGYVVVRAADGQSALAHLLHSSVPGLILLDLMMPGMNGWELWELLQRHRVLAQIPVVALTATAQMDRESLHLVDVADFVSKPFDIAELLACVRRIYQSDPPAPASGRRVTRRTVTPPALRSSPVTRGRGPLRSAASGRAGFFEDVGAVGPTPPLAHCLLDINQSRNQGGHKQ